MDRRSFSIEAANALIPQLRSRMTTVIQLHLRLREELARLRAAGRPLSWKQLKKDDFEAGSSPEIRRLVSRARLLYASLRASVNEIEALGLRVESVSEGLIDIPTEFDGEAKYFCWQVGEDEITHFHGCDAGFANRRPLQPRSEESIEVPETNEINETNNSSEKLR